MFGMAISTKTPVSGGAAPAKETKVSTQVKQRRRVCSVCGKPSGSSICGMCSDRIRAEALARKKREDKGEE